MVVVISYTQCMVWSPKPANPHPADHILLHRGVGERIRRATVRKLVGQGINTILKMRGKGRGTQTDAKEVTSHHPQGDECLISFQRGGYCGKAKPPVQWLSLALCDTQHLSDHPVVLFWLCPLPASCQPRGGQSWGAEKALTPCKPCSATPQTLVCYQHDFSCKVQVTMTQLTPSQPAPAHSLISKKSLFFFFPECSYLLSSFPFFCTMIIPRPSLHPLSDSPHWCLSQKKFVTSSVYCCAPRRAGRGSGELCKYILNCAG